MKCSQKECKAESVVRYESAAPSALIELADRLAERDRARGGHATRRDTLALLRSVAPRGTVALTPEELEERCAAAQVVVMLAGDEGDDGAWTKVWRVLWAGVT